MKGKSHKRMGQYLAEQYLDQASAAQRLAFRFGCIEPDKNPTTYLKGSLRSELLRGHNFSNAESFLCRLSKKLEQAEKDGLLFYYRLGKLIHYLADAFTWPHNKTFHGSLREHLRYEGQLQHSFLAARAWSSPVQPGTGTLFDWIRTEHRRYLTTAPSVENDCHFSMTAVQTAILWLDQLTEPAAASA